MGNQEEQCDEIPRKRGRPSGKNRTPLSQEERRARNALYERERRNETAEAMAQLAEASGCEINITNSDLLATVINQLQNAAKRKSSDSIEELKRVNENLMKQIASLEERLVNESPELDKENHNLKQQRPCETQSVPEPASPFCIYKERNIRKHGIKKKPKPLKCKSRRRTRAESDVDLPSSSSEARIEYQMTAPSPDSESGIESHPSPQSYQCQSQNGNINQNYMEFHSTECYASPELRDAVVSLLPEDRSRSEPLIHSDPERWSEGRSNFEETDKANVIATIWTNNQPGFLAQSQSPAPVSHQILKENQHELQTRPEAMLDLFTDSEKGIIMDCNELFGPEEFSDRAQTNSWSFTDFITEYL